METDEKYNGWTNYETWAVNLWIGNEEASYSYWSEQALAAKALPEDSAYGNRTASITLQQQLKEEITDEAPDLGCTLYADLLGAALSSVNWSEIADGLLEE